MAQLAYRPEIDGLRAVSVLAVLLFHAGLACPGGFVGVDVFFVISGYLITSLILKDLRQGRFRFADFWERRVRRIFPVLLLAILTTMVAGIVILLPADLVDLAESALAQSVFGSNVHFWQNTGYFDGPADLKPLLHTWSLAVEEQFYLCLPLALVLCRGFSTRQLVRLFGLFLVGSFVLSVWGTSAFQSATFYLLPTRAWELLLGSLLAVTVTNVRVGPRLSELLSWCGLASIGAALFWFDHETPFPGVNALFPCLGGGLIILANTHQLTFAGRLLAAPPAVLIGRLSYSLYLWHWPFLALSRYALGEHLSLKARLILVSLTFLAAFLSWRFIETPFRDRDRIPQRRMYAVVGTMSGLIVALSLWICFSGGMRFRYSEDLLAIIDEGQMATGFQSRRILPAGAPANDVAKGGFLLWGDSHGQAISELVDSLGKELGVPGYVAVRGATSPVLGTWRRNDGPAAARWNEEVIRFVRSRRIGHVILASRWSVNIDGRPDGSMNSLIVDAKCKSASPESARDVLQRGLHRTIQELQEAGANVWIIDQVPEQTADIPRLLARCHIFGWSEVPQGADLAEHQRHQANVHAVFHKVLAEAPQVRLLDPVPGCFDPSGRSRICELNRPYYADEHHLSRFGAERLLRPMLEPVFVEIAADHKLSLRNQPDGRVEIGASGRERVVR